VKDGDVVGEMLQDVEQNDDPGYAAERRAKRVRLHEVRATARPGEPKAVEEQIHRDHQGIGARSVEHLQHAAGATADLEDAAAGRWDGESWRASTSMTRRRDRKQK
jgi:hypothetical protein